MTGDFGILSVGAYVPRSRLQRSAVHEANAWFAPGLKAMAKGERAVASWDEDAITMGVEAARDALTGLDRAEVGAITLASTSLPYIDRLNAGVIKEALNLADVVTALDVTGSQRAGTSALLRALAGTDGQQHLCIASDLRKARPASEAELAQGDAAAALLVGRGDPIARLLGAHSITVDFVDHFRAEGETFDYAWESRWIRDEGYAKLLGAAVKAALERTGLTGAEIDRALIAVPVRGVPEVIAKKTGIRAEALADTLAATIGDAGSAHPLLMLAAALEEAKPGEKVLLASFGQGVDVAIFETTPAIERWAGPSGVRGALARRKPDSNYMRFLFHRGLLDLDRGMRAEQDQKQVGSSLYRNRKTVLGLVGGRCTKTGTVQFPKTPFSVNPNSRELGTQEDYELAERRARIVTYTADALTYSPNPPCYYGMIDFEGGGRMTAEFVDIDPEDVEVGREMRMVFRIKALDELREFKRYFWKATAAS